MSSAARTLVAVAIVAIVVAVVSAVCGVMLYRVTQHAPPARQVAVAPA